MEKYKSSKEFVKASFGNVIEWYDFSLYGIFAVAISHSFFPNYSQFMSLLMTFLTFSISFIARPIGSVIFGYIGDKMGKQYSVNLSIWCMAIPTVIIGFLPSYKVIGNTAPVLLMLLRFAQGISAGGQFSGLITIAAETDKKTRNYFIGLTLAISMLGSLIASIVGLISFKFFSLFSAEQTSWRLPFILSGVLFLIYLKLNPIIEKEEIKSDYKLKHIFKEQPYEVYCMILLSATMGGMYYILYSYSVSFMQIHLNMGSTKPLLALNFLLFISLFAYPLFGKLADSSANRILTAKRSTLIFALLTLLLSANSTFSWVLSCFSALILAYCSLASYLTSIFAEIFHQRYRMTACSICYSGGSIIAGFSPSVAELISKTSPSGFYMLLLCLTFALYLILDKIPETTGYKQYILKDYNAKMEDNTLETSLPKIRFQWLVQKFIKLVTLR